MNFNYKKIKIVKKKQFKDTEGLWQIKRQADSIQKSWIEFQIQLKRGKKKKEKNQHFNNCTRMGKGYELSIYGEEKLKGQ